MNRCMRLRRLIGSGRVFRNFEPTDYIRCVSNHATRTSVNAFSGSKSFSQYQGLRNESIQKSFQSVEEEGSSDPDTKIIASEEKQLKIIRMGDTVNLSEMLFTKNRDYLIKYNDPQLVTADQLAGKVVVIYFLGRDPYSSACSSDITSMTSLIDVYNDLKHKNCFEVVFVFIGDALRAINLEYSLYSPHHRSQAQVFEDIFSRMPWTAIPFSDITSRIDLKKRFRLYPVCRELSEPMGFLVDSTGMVLPTCCEDVIDMYGSLAYPFSDERLAFLDSECEAVAKQPSLKTLLASPERDYVISNKGEKVHIDSLEDKVVALYFYEDCISRCNPTKELIAAYQELAKNNIDFEVVLIYLTDTHDTCKCTNEETFKETFKNMPWLALPFKDPVYKKLKLLFDYPPLEHQDQRKKAPSIVIVGPYGEYIEPCGAEVLLEFGVSAFPFTRENLVISETRKVMDLKLEIMCSPTTVFRRKDGSQVQFSHFVGKRVIFYFESWYWDDLQDLATVKEPKYLKRLKEVEFLKLLKQRYLQMKGTYDEFEVIYVPWNESLCNVPVADMSWFVLPESKLLPGGSALLTYCGKFWYNYDWSFLLAFGWDGKLVRRTINPMFKHVEFPFYDGTLEDEAYYKLSHHVFSDGYWNRYYEGLLRNSFF